MSPNNSQMKTSDYDVAICGGGLAGLTLARQLKQELPDASIVLIDRLSRPLPEAAFKVGESLVETGSYYLVDTLKLQDYFNKSHIRKLGFRFFFDNPSQPFHRRPEFGLSQFPRVNSYQIDRGVLENDLRTFNEEAGVDLLEGRAVREIVLSEDGGLHEVHLSGTNGSSGMVRARWVVDAMGRRRYLQKKLGLTREHGKKCSSVWFRFEGRIDVDDLVPEEMRDWHERVPDNIRYYSTNHLMGSGYWIWLIPLSSGSTSVGIVALEELHPFESFNTFERAMDWLSAYEPDLAAYLEDREPLDFRTMRDYSYASKQLFSIERWACIGEAALFPDPFYALASDLIGFGNSIITDMVRRDRAGELTKPVVDDYNNYILSLNHWLTSNIQQGYPFFGNPVVMSCKVMWDTAGGWANLGPQMFNSLFLDQKGSDAYRKISGRFFFLTRAMQRLFADWAAMSPGRLSFDFIDFLSVPFLRDMQWRNLKAGKTLDEIIEDQVINMERLEEFAQVLFLLAVEDVMPDALDTFQPPIWLNAWGITLDRDKWDDRLFAPTTERRDLEDLRQQIRGLFSVKAFA